MASDLRMEPVDLTELMNSGVLMAANEAFFWPFGLALTWNYDKDTGQASNLHVTQWSHPEGQRERIEDDPDEVSEQRHRAFAQWASARLASMLPSERHEAEHRLAAIWGARHGK